MKIDSYPRYTPTLKTREQVCRHWLPLLLWALRKEKNIQIGVNPATFN